jgi:hypothetical protein
MRARTGSLLLLALPALVAQARPVATAREARAIAEQDTGGIAVSARRVPLNGATGGWEVDLHVPGETQGWRCTVDCDTRMVFRKTRIPNPPRPRKSA